MKYSNAILAAFSLCCLIDLSLTTGDVNGFLSFSQSSLTTAEDSDGDYTSVIIPFTREGGTADLVTATYKVMNSSAETDFLSVSNNVIFPDGADSQTGTLVLINDALPEGNETFLVEIVDTRFGAEKGSQTMLWLTVLASDEPFGRISFNEGSLSVEGEEPMTSDDTSSVTLTVNRGPGVFGTVTVNYKVTSGPSLGLLDLSPTEGQISFPEFKNTSSITFNISADDIPENDEQFTITLSNPVGGASLADTNTEAQLTVPGNDVPVRFGSSSVTIQENTGHLTMTVFRGSLSDGTSVGPTDTTTTVYYNTTSGTAIPGEDYTSAAGTITFAPGDTSSTFTVPILNDEVPEGDETFTVTLWTPSSDSVLVSPSTATIIISVNDNAGGVVGFQSTDTQIISEDSQTTTDFIVQRSESTIGDIIIGWSIVDENNQLAVDDFNPPNGTLTIQNGESQSTLAISAYNDNLAEEAELFTVTIDQVYNGAAKLENESLRIAMLYVSDSDDAYGLVEVVSGSGQVSVNNGARSFAFTIMRSGGSFGEVTVQYDIIYLPAGETDPAEGNMGVVTPGSGSLKMAAGISSQNATVQIFGNAFVDAGSSLYVNITGVDLTSGSPVIEPVASPRIGTTSTLTTSVPPTAASGLITYTSDSLTRTVQEPDSGFVTVTLTIFRVGQFGTATVTWTALAVGDSMFTSDDVLADSSVAIIKDGSTSTSFDILVTADSTPELDEPFDVVLLDANEDNQKVADTQVTAMVTIEKNDNPEGTFVIADASMGPHYITEQDLLTIGIQRNGGTLTVEQIQYTVTPNGDSEFFGASNIVTFQVGVSLNTISLLPIDDTIPEVNETFTLKLSATNNDLIGEDSSVTITILANDDYNGVFSFADSSLEQTINEPSNPGTFDNSLITTATFTVLRDVAFFGDATVYWAADNTTDITPTSGSVSFTEDQTWAWFNISAVNDQVTESDVTHLIELTSVDGGGRVSDSNITASLTITQNDAPIGFLTQDTFKLGEEGDMFTLTVVRGGDLVGVATVTFTVIYQTASVNDSLVWPSDGLLTFQDGVGSANINVSLIDENVPELNEVLLLKLVSTTGDVTIDISNDESHITILSSDDPQGVFGFLNSTMVTMDEGASVSLIVERDQGSFDNSLITWQIYQVTEDNELIPINLDSADFEVVYDVLTFGEGVTSQTIMLKAVDDDEAEILERFRVVLLNATEGRITNGNGSSIDVTIAANDDPHGVFGFPVLSDVWIAEDIPEDDEYNGTASYSVTRASGAYGSVTVIWEARPISSPDLPQYTDLILEGDIGPDVETLTDISRPYTETTAYNFTGESEKSVVTIAESGHHLVDVVSNSDFAISSWVYLDPTVDGMIVAKGLMDGSTIRYGLRVTASNSDVNLTFYYLPSNKLDGYSTVQVSVPQSTLPLMEWHSVLVNIYNTTLWFVVDGVAQGGTHTLAGPITDGEGGVLTVGGLANSMFYEGYLQDVRLYYDSLTQEEISELVSEPASDDIAPIVGMLVFDEAITDKTFTISSLSDDETEFNEQFNIKLTYANGGGLLSDTMNQSMLTVLKSDYSNGLFKFMSTDTVTTDEGQVLSLWVSRERGTYSNVTLEWEATTINGEEAMDDLLHTNGKLTFAVGETQQAIQLQVVDDTVPELLESFTVSLTSAIADDIYPNTDSISGPFIDTEGYQAVINVTANDDPYGIVQFAESMPVGDEVISIDDRAMIQVDIEESSGQVTVYVVRAQGVFGGGVVQYSIHDGTATNGVDYQVGSSTGTVEFSEGERVKSFTIDIIDNQVPELDKYFHVNLTIQDEASLLQLGHSRSLKVNILPSDDAFGIFSFTEDSRAMVVSEQVGGTPVTLTLFRGSKGLFGDVSVYWEVDGVDDDIIPANGYINFTEGLQSADFVVTVKNDMDPEFHEEHRIELKSVVGGGVIDTVGGANIAIITINANDYPYGLFLFSSSFRPLTVTESNELKNLTIVREFGKTGRVQVEYMSMEAINLEIDNTAMEGEDYVGVSDGIVIFEDGQTTQQISVSVITDEQPELDETFYIVLTNATLLDDPIPNIGDDVLPAVLSVQDNASIVIEENGNARGMVRLTSTSFSASEGDANFIKLERDQGTLGEVVVDWSITLDTALPADVSALTGTDTIPAGSFNGTLMLTVVDDETPEITESFTITLTGTNKGAVLGSPVSATVTIAPSDDPNGLFRFPTSSPNIVVHEPVDSTTVTLTVERGGGHIGISVVSWNLTSSEGTESDIHPTYGTLTFSSGQTTKTITITILGDDIPELEEVITVKLLSVTSGRLDGEKSQVTITVPANDKPYGMVSLVPNPVAAVETEGMDSIAMFTIQRTGSLLGAVEVTYAVRRSYPYSLDKFSSPVTGLSPMGGYRIDAITMFDTEDITNECAIRCVEVYSLCVAFVVDKGDDPLCELYSQTIGFGNVSRPSSVEYYEAISQLESLAVHLARPDEDFINGGNETIGKGMNYTIATATILDDLIPELSENFSVLITDVRALYGDSVLSDDLPTYDATPITGTIAENDLPYGLLRLHSGEKQVVSVKEGTSATFTIDREEGTFGEVSVTWNTSIVTPGLSPSELSELEDTVVFTEGMNKHTFTISVFDDLEPEGAESVQVLLSDPTGGAVLGEANSTVVTLVIQANDGAAGTVGFAVGSRAGTIVEGKDISLVLERTIGQSGIIQVYWSINGSNAENEFVNSTGSLIMDHGIATMSFSIAVKEDNSSELDQTFDVILTHVVPISTDVGEPSIDSTASIARLTVQASDNPYGQLRFSDNSLQVGVVEENPVNLTIIRDFGSHGAILIQYRAILSTLPLPVNMLAEAGIDFNDEIMTAVMQDGVTGVEIPIPIIDDDEPEFDEFLTVEIVSGSLMSDPSVSVPIVQSSSNLSSVTIEESDHPHGIIAFLDSTYRIPESQGILEIEVGRLGGSVSTLNIEYQLSHVDTSDQDFDFVQLNGFIVFNVGDNSSTIVYNIKDDLDPELDEEFCIQLLSTDPRVEFGDINITCVTIEANDDPYGVFNFTADSLHNTVTEAVAGSPIDTENEVMLTITRSGGTIGSVTIPYAVESAGTSDLSPPSSVVIFANGEDKKTFKLTAVADSDPELNETYSVSLGTPSSGRLADIDTVANVTILSNQDPYGVLTLTTLDGMASLSVEEDVGNATLEIRRTVPSFGVVFVNVSTSRNDSVDGSGDFNIQSDDFQELSTTVSFEPNQASVIIDIPIHNDDFPEIDELFYVSISDPVGGAVLGDQVTLPVTILTNDEAHGMVGFLESSLSVVIPEGDTEVILELERLGGTIGEVVIQWELSGDHNSTEVTPASGEVTFTNGNSLAFIVLNVKGDKEPELSEVTTVMLTDITNDGVPDGGDGSRGAMLISGRDMAVITVSANDEPHGVFQWSVSSMDFTEANKVVSFNILREFGTIGDVALTYRTSTTSSSDLALTSQATAGEDYENVTNTVVFRDGQTAHVVNISIYEDDIPELTEYFNITITQVVLINDTGSDPATPPRIKEGLGYVFCRILENDDPYGLIHFSDLDMVSIPENQGLLCLPVERSQGTFQQVTVDFTVTGITATGGGVDYSPDSGTIEFDPMMDSQCIDITIVNDLSAEIEETFTVTLSNAEFGANLGSNITKTVAIEKNDDINGVFSLAADSLVLLIPEGDEGTLTINRAKGTVGVVTVYWVLEEGGASDLTPSIGNVTFQDGDTSKSFTIQAIEDDLPELYESFTLFLMQVSGESGRITSPKTASIAIPASNAPNGVIGLDSYPLNTIIVHEGDSVTVSAIRTGGLFGAVGFQWELTPTDATVFVATSATAEFADGQDLLNFTISTIQDSIAEVARKFELSIVAVSDAEINETISTLTVIVPASDDAHGSVSFSSILTEVDEDDGVISVTIERTGGLVGDIRVNYTAENREAFSPSDYVVSTNSLVIPDESNTGTISVSIEDDSLPEVDESFVIILNSVELVDDIDGGRDFTFEGDVSLIDSEPVLGSVTTTTIDILENDDANGVFQFSASSVTTNEGETLVVEIERAKGSFGISTVFYSVTAGTATEGSDYTVVTSTDLLTFAVGEQTQEVVITITNDTTPELEETFTVMLTGVNGGGRLGSVTMQTVRIASSDDPYGTVGFSIVSLVVANSLSPLPQTVTINKEGGGAADVDVTLSVNGTDSDIVLFQNTLVISAANSFTDVTLQIQGSADPEPEEVFALTITSVTNGAKISEDNRQLLITIQQGGEPYGVFNFYAEALGTQVATELSNLTFPVRRNQGTLGSVEVYFTVSGSSPAMDVHPSSGSISFTDGQIFSAIILQVLDDSTPELHEDYTISLTEASGLAVIGTEANTASFRIEANDSPHGTFGITDTFITVHTLADESIIRTLSFTIHRDYGSVGSVQVHISVSYLPEPSEGYFVSNITRVFGDGQNTSIVSIDSTPDAFLESNAVIRIQVTSVVLLTSSEGSDLLPEISPSIGTVNHHIEDGVANTVVGFSLSSIQATVIDGLDVNNVILTIERNGSVGGVQVSWSVGMHLEGVANGSLTPVVGSIMIPFNTTEVVVPFTATPTDPPASPEVFAVNLYIESLSSLSAKVAEGRGTAVVEPRGMVKLRYDSFSNEEGSTVFVTVSRLFGSVGEIIVSGISMTATAADLGTNEIVADPITDYPLQEKTVTLSDGVTSGDISLILPYNSGTSPLKVFKFVLTSVETSNDVSGSTTPRLATPNNAIPITIIDSDGGAGVFEFQNSSVTVSEEGSPVVLTYIRRNGGLLGTVTVEVTILSTRADGTTPDNQIASISDYDSASLFSLVTFASHEDIKPVSIQILDDNVPEITEYFTLKLQNPLGGKALINSDKSTYEIAIVSNDNQGGLFSLITHSLVLSEDDAPQGTLQISRELGLFEMIEIYWRASYTDGKTHNVALGDLLVADEGVVTFYPGQSLANFTIVLQANKVPLTTETFTVTISSDATSIVFGTRTATITALPSGFSEFQFTESSRRVVSSPFTVTLRVERTKGVTLDTSIRYSTEEPSEPVTVGQVTFQPALAGSHFTLVAGDTVFFEPNKANESLHISIISSDDIPRVFYVNLETVDSSDSVVNSRATILITSTGTSFDLYSIYFDVIDASTSELYSIATRLQSLLPDIDNTESSVLLYTLDEIMSTVNENQYSYSNSLRAVMSDIYESLVSDTTYAGRNDIVESVTAYGNSLLSAHSCDNSSEVVSQTSFLIRSVRIRPSSLHTLELTTTDNDFIRLPNTNLEVSTECVNVIFVSYSSINLFSGPILGDKIITVSLQEPSVTKLNTPVVYRITSPDESVLPSSNSCLIWRMFEGQGYWDSSTCKLAKSSIIEMGYIECECQSLGQYAVAPPVNYGWTIPGPISCAFVTLVMIIVIFLHLFYFRRITLGTRIFIMFCSSVAIFELLALVDMVVSVNVSTSGCIAMGLLLQLAVVAMFVWMFVLVLSLWLNLMGLTSGREPLIIYIFISWGLSAAIVIATVLISIYALSFSFDEVYGRVGEFCFIPSAGVAGVSTGLPIVLAVLFAVGMVSHSCIYWTKWEDIQSLYKDTYNRRDIPLLLVLYLLLVLMALFCGLHLYLQQIYLFFVFFAFNVIFGVYAVVVYVCMSWHTLTWKHKHYPIKEEVQPFSIPGEPDEDPIPLRPLTIESNYGSQQSLIPRYQPHPVRHGGTVKSTNSSVIIDDSSRPPTLTRPHPPPSNAHQEQPMVSQSEPGSTIMRSDHDSEGGDSDSEAGGNYNITMNSDEEGSQMDDLLYAIRTGGPGGGTTDGSGYSASQGGGYEDDDDMQPLVQATEVMRRNKPGGGPRASSDQYRMRRISIADTHL